MDNQSLSDRVCDSEICGGNIRASKWGISKKKNRPSSGESLPYIETTELPEKRKDGKEESRFRETLSHQLIVPSDCTDGLEKAFRKNENIRGRRNKLGH